MAGLKLLSSASLGAAGEEGKALEANSPILPYTAEHFGAKGDGLTDDTVAFQKASEAAVAAGGGIIRLFNKTYIVDGYLWEAGVYWEGASSRSSGGTILKAKAGSSNAGLIMIPKGVVNKAGWKNIAFLGNGNANQDCFYLYAQEPEGGGNGGVWSCKFENLEVGTTAAPFLRNGFWFRGGSVTGNAKTPHQFNVFKNVTVYRPNSGTGATTSRALKCTGQVEKFEFDAACSFNGTVGGTQVGTNIELSREFTQQTTLSAEAASGQKVIKVTSATGFEASKKISVGEGSKNELAEVESIAGTEITLKANLTFTHATGENVYFLAGTVGSPSTWAPSDFTFISGAVQNADLEILCDKAVAVNFINTDFENQSRILRRRNECFQVNLKDVRADGASEGTSNGTGSATVGSAELTGCTGTWLANDKISGPGIPLGETVKEAPEAGKVILNKVVEANGTTGATSIPLAKGGRGEGYVVSNEGKSVGYDSFHVEGVHDRTIINLEGSARALGLSRSAALPTIGTSGVVLALATAATLTVYSAPEIVLTDAAQIVKTIKGLHAVGEELRIRATTANTKIEEGGNIGSVPNGKCWIGPGDVMRLVRTDYGTNTWIVVTVNRPNGYQWQEIEGLSAKLEIPAEYPAHVQVALDDFGLLHLRGSVKGKEELAGSGTMFTLPAGFRPESKRDPVAGNSGERANNLIISTTGSVATSQKIAAGQIIGLDAVPPFSLKG